MKQPVEIKLENKEQPFEIVILESGNPFRDLRLFTEALDNKFRFKNKDNFIKDLIKLIHFRENKTTEDLDQLTDEFFNIIRENSSEPALEQNIEKAGKELEKFIKVANKWQKK